MPVKLRLRRVGAKHQPRYRIVAADSRSPRDGRFIEVIGYYNPERQPHELDINHELALKWLGRGAQPTETVGDLLTQAGVMAKFNELRGKPVAAPAVSPSAPPPPAEAPEAVAVAVAAPAAEAPSEAAPEAGAPSAQTQPEA